MTKMIKELQKEIEEIKALVNFMTKYSKDEIEFCHEYNKKMLRHTHAARFIKDGELCTVCFPIIWEQSCKFTTLENDENSATILCKNGLYGVETYIILDKSNETAVEYKNFMTNKK